MDNDRGQRPKNRKWGGTTSWIYKLKSGSYQSNPNVHTIQPWTFNDRNRKKLEPAHGRKGLGVGGRLVLVERIVELGLHMWMVERRNLPLVS